MKPVTFAKLEAVEATVVMRWEHFGLTQRELRNIEGAIVE
jgi:hypothetical protein